MKTIADAKFGSEWQPKLTEFMLDHPWPDSDFVAPTGEIKPGEPVTAEFVAESRRQWKLRMRELPTQAALDAWTKAHATDLDRMLGIFGRLRLTPQRSVDAIVHFGCTGLAAHGVTIDDIKFFRLGLAGSGVGLPCFVPPNRYCLAHEVSGGLQDRQKPAYPEAVDKVARPLTPEEEAHDKLVMAARKVGQEGKTHEILHGHTMPQGWEQGAADVLADEEIDPAKLGAKVDEDELRQDQRLASCSVPAAPLFVWACDEHKKTNWSCRYCVAQAIVEGELAPSYAITTESTAGPGPGVSTGLSPAEAANEMHESSTRGDTKLILYACVATFTRKLARD